MRSRSSKNEIRRCRPLLGALVEITASGLEELRNQTAMDAAFAAIVAVQNRMSVHDRASELSVINAEAHRRPVRVSESMFTVISRAQALAELSGGAFDFTVGATLARWQILPAHLCRGDDATWRDVELLSGQRVVFRRPLTIDLGGIAKGYAVDQAVQALVDHGATAGVVNAGGDLRVFGQETTSIYLRHPAAPTQMARRLCLRNSALATSSPCFSQRQWRRQTISHLVRRGPGNGRGRDRGRDGQAVTGIISVSVRAGECWLADALTKVVLNAPDSARAILAAHEARAWVLAA